jgi:hypothetical protein
MASTEFSLDVALKSLNEEGFVYLHALAVGGHVSEMEQKGFVYKFPSLAPAGTTVLCTC